MADSDNSTTLPSVTQERGDRRDVSEADLAAGADPALVLLAEWWRTQHVSRVLCRLQQRLERRVLDAAYPKAMDEKVNYSIAYHAEIEAATAALALQDRLLDTPARSLPGIVAKLEMIVGADREIDDLTDFPWPHIASVVRDLKAIVGSVPIDRPAKAVVRADISSHWRGATKLVSALERDGVERLC